MTEFLEHDQCSCMGENTKSLALPPVFIEGCSGITEMKGGGIVARPAPSQGEQALCPTALRTRQGEEVRDLPALHGHRPPPYVIWDLDLGACRGGKRGLHISIWFAIDCDMIQVLLP